MKKVLVTGAQGYVPGFIVPALLEAGYQVVGIDNQSKYGPVTCSYDKHPGYTFVCGDVKDVRLMTELAADCHHLVAAAALIGGIHFYHQRAFDLMAENSRILASTMDAALRAHRGGNLEKVTVLSSSVIFERTRVFPTPETRAGKDPTPMGGYGFHKMMCESYVRSAQLQYGLPYTILRLFNCMGIGGWVHQPGSSDAVPGVHHVIPDLIAKVLAGQNPLRLFGNGRQTRSFTHGLDIARSVVLSLENDRATNQDFNIGRQQEYSIREVAELILHKIAPGTCWHIETDEISYANDIMRSLPDTTKAEQQLGFKAEISLEDALDEIVAWVRDKMEPVGG